MKRIIFLAAFLAPFLSAISLQAADSDRKAPPKKVQESEESTYRIHSGDTLSINVWRVPLLTQDVIVGLDGTFLYPLLGSVPAEGKTIDEIRKYLTEALGKNYLVGPVVTVVLASKTQEYFVVGEVKKPGAFKMEERIDVYQAIITAGGFTDFASKRVKIIRKTSGQKKVIKVNIGKFHKKYDPEANIQPGDVIEVPKRLF